MDFGQWFLCPWSACRILPIIIIILLSLCVGLFLILFIPLLLLVFDFYFPSPSSSPHTHTPRSIPSLSSRLKDNRQTEMALGYLEPCSACPALSCPRPDLDHPPCNSNININTTTNTNTNTTNQPRRRQTLVNLPNFFYDSMYARIIRTPPQGYFVPCWTACEWLGLAQAQNSLCSPNGWY